MVRSSLLWQSAHRLRSWPSLKCGDFGRIIPDLQRIITAIETEIGELERLAT